MAKQDKKAVVVEVVSPSDVKITGNRFVFEYKKVKIETPDGVTYDREMIIKLFGDKLRKHKVDLSDLLKEYLKAAKKKK